MPQENKVEDTEKVFKKFCMEDLKMNNDEVQGIRISNIHRIPRNPKNTYKPGAPNAIMVKFSCMSDRNLILSLRNKLSRESHKTVRTDLPNNLKEKRATLSRKAYQLRRNDMVKTRLRETSENVWLEVRKEHTQPWTVYTD